MEIKQKTKRKKVHNKVENRKTAMIKSPKEKSAAEKDRTRIKGLCLFIAGLAAFLFCLGIGLYGYNESRNATLLADRNAKETSEQVKDVTRVMETMQTTANDMETAVHTLDNTVDGMQDSISEIASILPEDVDLKEKMKELAELSSELIMLKTNIDKLKSEIGEVSSASGNQEGQLADISEETYVLTKSIVNAHEEIYRITQRLTVLQDELQVRITTEEGLGKALEVAKVNLALANKEVADNLKAVSGELDNAQSMIAYLQDRAAMLDKLLSDAKTQINDEISSTREELNTTITNNYNMYNGDMETLKGNLTDQINQLSGRVDSCFQSVSEGKTGLASALTDEGVRTNSDASFGEIKSGIVQLSGQRYETGYNDGYANGFQKAMEGVRIEYTYHDHTGDGEEGGGCYSVLCHEPGYYTYTYCNSTSFGTAGCKYVCTRCGSTSGYGDFHDCSNHNMCTASNSRTEVYTYYVCSNGHYTTSTSRPDKCNAQASKTYHEGKAYYVLGCGKTTETIETATLHFD